MTLQQHALGGPLFAAHPNERWPIPLSVTWLGGSASSIVELDDDSAVTRAAGACGDTALIDSGVRPPFLVHYDAMALERMGSGGAISLSDREKILRDTVTLTHSSDSTAPELLAAIDLAPEAAVQSNMTDVADTLLAVLKDLQGSPTKRIVQHATTSLYGPLVADFARQVKPQDQIAPARVLNALAYCDDAQSAQTALVWWRGVRDRRDYDPSGWGRDPLAASVATDADVAWVLARYKPPGRYGFVDHNTSFLFGLADPHQVERAFAALADMKSSGLASVVSEVGSRHPAVVSAWLDAHADVLMSSTPPAQRAATLAAVAANGPWSARSPQQWKAFLQRHLSTRDAHVIDDAVATIRRHWQRRHELEEQFQSVGDRAS